MASCRANARVRASQRDDGAERSPAIHIPSHVSPAFGPLGAATKTKKHWLSLFSVRSRNDRKQRKCTLVCAHMEKKEKCWTSVSDWEVTALPPPKWPRSPFAAFSRW
nr:hypothetical protein [Pandoravirus massiliensis]